LNHKYNKTCQFNTLQQQRATICLLLVGLGGMEEITHPIYGEIKKQDMVLLRNKPVKFEWNRNCFIVTPQYMYI